VAKRRPRARGLRGLRSVVRTATTAADVGLKRDRALCVGRCAHCGPLGPRTRRPAPAAEAAAGRRRTRRAPALPRRGTTPPSYSGTGRPLTAAAAPANDDTTQVRTMSRDITRVSEGGLELLSDVVPGAASRYLKALKLGLVTACDAHPDAPRYSGNPGRQYHAEYQAATRSDSPRVNRRVFGCAEFRPVGRSQPHKFWAP
jgi:hypothetical protein